MKVSVIGAGPSGCIAAASSLGEGHMARIYEEHRRIGFPEQCGGLLSKVAIDWFSEVGVNFKGIILNKIRGAELFFRDSSINIPGSETKAFVVKRSKFDQECANFAKGKGAIIETSKKLDSKSIKELAKSSFIIGADGPFSTVAKAFNFPKIEKYAVAYQINVTNLDFGKAEKNKVQVYFYDKAFGWLIPLNEEEAHVGVIFFENPDARRLKWMLDQIKEKYSKRILHTENYFVDCVPMNPRSKIQKKDVYLVGDAAGQVKATSGGGIYYGCKSAWLAGKNIRSNNYEDKWRKEIGKELEQHLFARKIINRLNSNILCSFLGFVSFFGMEKIFSKYDMENISSLVSL